MVESNYKTIYPKHEGVFEKIYLKSGDKVEKNDILADLNSDKMLSQLKILESIKRAKTQEKKMLATFKNKPNRVVDDSELLAIQRQIVQERYRDLQNAKMQLKNHLITNADMRSVKDSYQDAKQKYAFYKKQGVYQNSNNYQPLPKVINIEEVELKIADQKKLLEEFRIFSPVDGTVYEVNAQVGDRISKRDSFIILWTHNKPQIIVTLSSYKAVDLQIGSKVEIVDSVGNQKFNGVVKGINDLELDNNIKMVTSKKANEVFVTIEPEEGAKVLPPHSIVKVLFKRTFGF
jgi:multidrug resistance efflux pump